MIRLTLQQIKENLIEWKFKDLDQDLYQEEKDQLIENLKDVNTIQQLAPFFDDENISSWDVISIIEGTLGCCCEAE